MQTLIKCWYQPSDIPAQDVPTFCLIPIHFSAVIVRSREDTEITAELRAAQRAFDAEMPDGKKLPETAMLGVL